MYSTADDIADPNSSLYDNHDERTRTLVEWLDGYNHGYASHMISAQFLSTVNPEGATYGTPLHTSDSMKLLKHVNCMVVLNGRHSNGSVEVLRREDGVKRATRPLRLRYSFRVDGKPASPAQVINLSKTAKLCILVLQLKEMIIDMIHSSLSYAQAFE